MSVTNQLYGDTNLDIQNQVIKIVEGFGIDAHLDGNGSTDRYICSWNSSGFKFTLDFCYKSIDELEMKDVFSGPNIHVLVVSDQCSIDFDLITTYESSNQYFIIFDKSEDIQMFSKDFWNLITFIYSTQIVNN